MTASTSLAPPTADARPAARPADLQAAARSVITALATTTHPQLGVLETPAVGQALEELDAMLTTNRTDATAAPPGGFRTAA